MGLEKDCQTTQERLFAILSVATVSSRGENVKRCFAGGAMLSARPSIRSEKRRYALMRRRRSPNDCLWGFRNANPNENHKRRGTAVVEVAVCLPVLLTVTLLLIEFSNLIFVRQTLKVASYEGIRVAIKQGSEIEDVRAVCENILNLRQVIAYDITVTPDTFSAMERGELVTVTIEINKEKNRLFGLLTNADETVEVSSFGLKE